MVWAAMKLLCFVILVECCGQGEVNDNILKSIEHVLTVLLHHGETKSYIADAT